MKNVCILFSGGSYGTFVEWCLHYFSDSKFDITMPLRKNGNSHNYLGHHLLNFNGCKNYIDSDVNYDIVRYHLRTNKDEDVVENFKYTYNNFKKVIYLHPTKNSIAWTINNKFEKIWQEGWLKKCQPIFFNNLLQWGTGKNIDTMEFWEVREFLSYYIYEQHLSEIDLSNLPLFKKQFSNSQFIAVEDLRDNFVKTIKNLLEYCELPLVRHNFDKIHSSWLECQIHTFKDSIIKDIVDQKINAWNKLTIVDEALIQYFLRKKGIEMRCFGLNLFPTNIKELNELLYDIA